MKKKLLALFAIMAVFGLAIAAYAYTRTTETARTASCCKKSESCPMKAHADHNKASHDAKSCPMKNHESTATSGEGHSCCGCCGDSCPMKKGEAATVSVSAETKSCCDNCDCCGGKKGTAV